MKLIWEEPFTIKSYEIDFSKKLKFSSLFNFFQEAAGNHANNLNCGIEGLRSVGLTWVLSRIKISMDKYPIWNDNIVIETWAKDVDKLFAIRDFLIKNEQKEIIGKATSSWVVLDLNTFKMQKIEKLPVQYPRNNSIHGLDETLEKIEPEIDNIVYSNKILSTYSDIDLNDHVNNARYIDWIFDSFPKEYFEKHNIKSLQVNYLREVKYNDNITINRASIKNKVNAFYVEGVNQEKHNSAFQSIVEWL